MRVLSFCHNVEKPWNSTSPDVIFSLVLALELHNTSCFSLQSEVTTLLSPIKRVSSRPYWHVLVHLHYHICNSKLQVINLFFDFVIKKQTILYWRGKKVEKLIKITVIYSFSFWWWSLQHVCSSSLALPEQSESRAYDKWNSIRPLTDRTLSLVVLKKGS